MNQLTSMATMATGTPRNNPRSLAVKQHYTQLGNAKHKDWPYWLLATNKTIKSEVNSNISQRTCWQHACWSPPMSSQVTTQHNPQFAAVLTSLIYLSIWMKGITIDNKRRECTYQHKQYNIAANKVTLLTTHNKLPTSSVMHIIKRQTKPW
jgi:hypothetical protein